MPTMQFAIDIDRPAEAVFGLITDLARYRTWLPPSNSFSNVAQLSSGPVVLGTPYIDTGPSAVFQGEVTQFRPHTHVTFYQASRFNLLTFNVGMNICIDYTLHEKDGGTHVIRNLALDLLGVLRLIQPVLLRTIRNENERILRTMKTYLEATS
jgi:carbon monoxide dehydrogenase subunit G